MKTNPKQTKYTLPVGTMRYRVDIMDDGEAQKLAASEGWVDGDSLFDFIDPIDNAAVESKTFATELAAFRYAKANAERDVFKTPSIQEVELVNEVAGGTVFREWENKRRWLIVDGDIEEDLT